MTRQYFKSKDRIKPNRAADKHRQMIRRRTARILLELELDEYPKRAEPIAKEDVFSTSDEGKAAIERLSLIDDLSAALAAKV